MREDLTPKEKAKELINKFYQPLGYIKHNENSDNLWEHGKKLALICVDELIELMTFYNLHNDEDWVEKYGYLLEVKREIEKL